MAEVPGPLVHILAPQLLDHYQIYRKHWIDKFMYRHKYQSLLVSLLSLSTAKLQRCQIFIFRSFNLFFSSKGTHKGVKHRRSSLEMEPNSESVQLAGKWQTSGEGEGTHRMPSVIA